MKLLEAIITTAAEILGGLFKLLLELIGLGASAFAKRDGTYTATFAPQRELLSRRHQGFCLTGVRSLTRKDSSRHVVVFSPSGGGKSTVVVVPSILRITERPCSLVVHDPSGELYNLTSGTLAARGFRVRRISFAHPEGGDRYNPMARAHKNADLRKVSTMIVRHAMGGNKADPFWDQSASSLITVIMQVLQTQPEAYRNLGNVRHLLNLFGSDPEKLDALIARHASEEVFREYASIQAYQDKMRSGIIASARAALDLWTDEDIALLTSGDTLDLESLRTQPTILYVQSHTAQLDYFSVLVSLLFEQLIGVLMQALPGPEELDVYVIIDEASSLRVPILPIAISNLRKYRVPLMLLYQDYSQLIHLYGRHEAETIRQNAFVKMYFSDQSLDTATDLERLMGKYEAKDEEGRHRVRPLLTSDEIRVLAKDRALVIAGGHRPVLAKLRPFYEQSRLRQLTQLPPVVVEGERHPPLVKLSFDAEPASGAPIHHVPAE